MFQLFPPKKINFYLRYYDPTECMGEYKKAVSGILETYNDRKINEEGDKEDKTFSARLLDAQYVLNNSYHKKECLLHTLKETTNNGVLVYGFYYNTVEVLDYVLSTARIPHKEISGHTTDKQCKQAMEWFNENPNDKAIILTSAGAQSINLQSTNNFIFYDLPYTSGQFIQAIGRIIRLGSKYEEFNIYIILSKDTLDEYKYNYLGSNQETLQYIQGNPNLFSADLKNPNSEILKQLRKQMLWNKSK